MRDLYDLAVFYLVFVILWQIFFGGGYSLKVGENTWHVEYAMRDRLK